MSVAFPRVSPVLKFRISILAALVMSIGIVAVGAQAQTATTTALTVSPASPQSAGAVETLTATVTANSASVKTPGSVVFCDDATGTCGFLAQLGRAQITSSGTATLKVRLAPGSHNIYAKFRGTPAGTSLGASSSFASAASYTVTASASTYPSTSVTVATGNSSAYTLTNTLVTDPSATTPTSLSGTFYDVVGNQSLGSVTYGSTGSSISFSPGAIYTTESIYAANSNYNGTRAIAVGDFNNDGIPDILLLGGASTGSIYCQLFTGNANAPGTFTAGAAQGISHTGFSIVVGDFNNDGYLDFAYMTTAGAYVYLNKPTSPGTFTAAGTGSALSTPGTGISPHAIALGDFNGDGNLDLAVPIYASGSTTTGFQIFTGNGDGTFTAGTSVATTNTINGMGAADLNGDGYTDLWINTYTTMTTPLYYQNSGASPYFSGTPTTTINTVSGSSGYTVAFADVKNDGVLDIMFPTSNGLSLVINSSTSPGTLTTPVSPTFAASAVTTTSTNGTSTAGLTLADFNGDGVVDAALGNTGGTIGIAAGNSTTPSFGTFTYYTASPLVSTQTYALVSGDFTGSGLQDIASGTLATISPLSVIFSGNLTTSTSLTGVTLDDAGLRNVDAVTTSSSSTLASTTSNSVQILGGNLELAVSPTSTAMTGATVTLTASIDSSTIASAGTTPNGKVTFYDGMNALGTAVAVNASGVATYPTTSLTAGIHTLSAQYTGDTTIDPGPVALISPSQDYEITSLGTATQIAVLEGPAKSATTSVASGGNLGVIQIAEEDVSGNIVASSGGMEVTLTNISSGNVIGPLPTNAVGAVAIVNPGSGYTSAPTVTFTGGSGTGAAATATINEIVSSVTFSGGTGYTAAPTVTISGGGGSGATATATETSGVVKTVTITNPGTGYTSPPTVTFSAPTSGTTATGTAVLTGVVSAVTMTSAGSGYTSAPTVTFSAPGTGTTATGTAVDGTYSGGVATFDLSQLPLYSATAQNYTLTYEDQSGSPSATATIAITLPTAVYVVTKYTTATGTCTNFAGLTPPFALDPTCTLRAALTNVTGLTSSQNATISFDITRNALSWPQTIPFSTNLESSTYGWVSGLTISGPGMSNLILDGASTNAFFKQGASIPAANVFNLSGMTLQNGSSGYGGALYLYGSAAFTNVKFYKNVATSTGGAIYRSSSATSGSGLTVNNCIFDTNSGASGGAIGDIAPNPTLTVSNSYFTSNQATSSSGTGGGAISVASALSTASTYAITSSTFYNNSSVYVAGALNMAFSSSTAPPTINLTNDTFYANYASGGSGGAIFAGGGISVANYAALNLNNTTVVGNYDSYTSGKGGGVYGNSYSAVTLTNSVVEGNEVTGTSGTTPDLYAGGTVTLNTSLANTSSSTTPAYAYPGLVSLLLSDLGNYGGSVPTLVPLPGSPLLKVGTGNTTVTTDARGILRPTSGATTVDVGAVQTDPTPLFSAGGSPGTQTVGSALTPTPVLTYEDNNSVLGLTNSQVLPITLAIDPGSLSGTFSYNASTAGSATFSSVLPETAATGAELIATFGSGTGTVSVSSAAFNVSAGSTSKVAFISDPTASLSAGSASSNFTVAVEDSSGNINGSATITLTITGPPGYGGYNRSVATANGVAAFTSLPVLTIAGTYTYTASASGLTSAVASETVTLNTTALMLSVTPATTEPYGTEVTLTATLSPYSQGAASTNSETITFESNGTIIGMGTLASGVATFTTGGLNVGIDRLTASYAGDTSFSASTSTGINETSTPPAFAVIQAGTPVTVTLAFTNNFTMGSTSPSIATGGTANSPFSITGRTCTAGTAYGPATTTSCTVTVTYTPSSSSPATGGGFITGTVQAFDTNSVLQGASNVTVSRYR